MEQTNRQTDTQTNIATCSLNWPRDRLSTNMVIEILETQQKLKLIHQKKLFGEENIYPHYDKKKKY